MRCRENMPWVHAKEEKVLTLKRSSSIEASTLGTRYWKLKVRRMRTNNNNVNKSCPILAILLVLRYFLQQCQLIFLYLHVITFKFKITMIKEKYGARRHWIMVQVRITSQSLTSFLCDVSELIMWSESTGTLSMAAVPSPSTSITSMPLGLCKWSLGMTVE